MNILYGKPSSSSSGISSRVTIVIPSVEHTLSKWISLPRTTNNYCYFITPDKPSGVYVRRFWCGECSHCESYEFLLCVNESCGKWEWNNFKLKKGEVAADFTECPNGKTHYSAIQPAHGRIVNVPKNNRVPQKRQLLKKDRSEKRKKNKNTG